MKLLALLSLLPALIQASPAAAPEAPELAVRQADSACNPYTDWGHTRGTKTYFCANLAGGPNTDYHCISYKSADYRSGKIYCDYSGNKNCPGNNSFCHHGICVDKANVKQCQRTSSY